MIRVRLMAAVRRQDWMAVTIELLTVMFGLFLGLQLNAWKEEHDARVREHLALIRLADESEAIVAYFHDSIEWMAEVNRRQESAIAALSTGKAERFNATELAERLGTLSYYPAIAPPRIAYDELTSSGMMTEVGSIPVRTAIAEYYSELDWIQSQLDYFRLTWAANMTPGERSGWTRRYDTGAANMGEAFIASVDFEVVANDHDQMSLLVEQFEDQLKFQSYRRGVANKAKLMCDALAQALQRSCQAADDAPSPAASP